jgi:hypothetical protein
MVAVGVTPYSVVRVVLSGMRQVQRLIYDDRHAKRSKRKRQRLGGNDSSSWPGLSRPSTSKSNFDAVKDVDARDKPGHDGEIFV